MGWKVSANFFHPYRCRVIGHDKQNQRFSRFRMINGTGGAFIDPWNRSDSRCYLGKTHPYSSHFQKCPLASFDP
jgi:hypothetical protein